MPTRRDAVPWYQRARRWGQTNLTEIDPLRCDVAWWREHWRRTGVQGVIVNAGGIVAYYPSRFPLHHRAEHLGERDLFGEFVRAAREEGLAVLARMDSNRLHEEAYHQHPEWFARDRDGQPLQAGDRRSDFGLADLFGVRAMGAQEGTTDAKPPNWETYARHTYLRLLPSRFAPGQEPPKPSAAGGPAERHEVLADFEETDILAFGGRLERVEPQSGVSIPLTYIPAFPIYPPEFAWMRVRQTDAPGLVLHEPRAGGRVAYLAADIDRCHAREQLPDHGRLLANLVRWAASGNIPLRVEGPGYIDCHLYRQEHTLVLHLVNLTHYRAWPAPVAELVPVGPFRVRIRLPHPVDRLDASLLVSGGSPTVALEGEWAVLDIDRVLDHEVLVIKWLSLPRTSSKPCR